MTMHKKRLPEQSKSKFIFFGTLSVLAGAAFLMVLTIPEHLINIPFTASQKLVRTVSALVRISTPTPTARATPTPTPEPPTPTPTPRPPTFAELNAQYGPCAIVPTLMYHHIQSMVTAKEEDHASLTVDTGIFERQMQYLKDHGYTPIQPEQLIAFFDGGAALPGKPVMITVDDGYADFASDAAPILHSFGFPAVAFIPTGLLENPGYMTWQNVQDQGSQGIYMANHTWSHKSVSTSLAEDQSEIGTADQQLSQHGENAAKVFAYPYGNPSTNGTTVLSSLGYKLGFTTYPGWTQCRGQRYILPRTRIGNANLNSYGL